MKRTFITLAGLLALAAAAPLGAQDIKINIDPNKTAEAAKPAAPSAAPAAPAGAKFTDEQKFEVWGWLVAQQLNLAELGLSPAEFSALARGMALNLQGREPTYPSAEIGPQVQALLESRMQAAQARIEKQIAAASQENTKAADAYLATLKGKPGIVELPSGLRYEILQAGKGAKPKPEQTVVVNYKGSLIDGQVFDSSEGKGPATFVLNKVVPGFSEGLQLVGQGGKIKLYVPAKLAYGDNGPLPPGALTIFEVEVLEVKDTPKEAPAPAAPGK